MGRRGGGRNSLVVNRIPEVKKKQMQKKLLNNIDKEDNPYAEDIEVAIEDEQVPMQRTAVQEGVVYDGFVDFEAQLGM